MAENNFDTEYREMIDILQNAHDQLETAAIVNSAAVRERLLANFKREINSLSARVGVQGVITVSKILPKPTPIRTMFGIDVTPRQKVAKKQLFGPNTRRSERVAAIQETSQDSAGRELVSKTDKLYPDFINIPNDNIRDSYPNVEILAVAKKAGLPVTEDTKVNNTLIDEIKKAIKKKALLEEKDQKIMEEVNKAVTK